MMKATKGPDAAAIVGVDRDRYLEEQNARSVVLEKMALGTLPKPPPSTRLSFAGRALCKRATRRRHDMNAELSQVSGC